MFAHEDALFRPYVNGMHPDIPQVLQLCVLAKVADKLHTGIL